jgi:hypothetical protein
MRPLSSHRIGFIVLIKIKVMAPIPRVGFAHKEACTMPPTEYAPPPSDTPEAIPFMQRVLDNPFLLLFLGVAIPTVLFTLWGVMEVASIPIAK